MAIPVLLVVVVGLAFVGLVLILVGVLLVAARLEASGASVLDTRLSCQVPPVLRGR